MCYFSQVFIQKANNFFEVKLDIQKGALGFRENLTLDVLVSSNSRFHPLLSYGYSPQ